MVWLFLIPIVFIVLVCVTIGAEDPNMVALAVIFGIVLGGLIGCGIGSRLPTCVRTTATIELKTFSNIPGNYYVIDENVRGKSGGDISVTDGKESIPISSYSEKENAKPELIKRDNPFKYKWHKWIGLNVNYSEKMEVNVPKGKVLFLFD